MTVYNFPSNVPITPAGSNDDPNTSSLMLGTVFHSTVAGVQAMGVRFWVPAAGAGETIRGYLFVGSSGSTVLASSSAVTAVSGWNTLTFTTPYTLTSGTDVTAAAYILGLVSHVYYPAVAGALTSAQTVSPLQNAATGARYNYGNVTASLALSGGDNFGSSSAWYGVDIIASDAAGVPVVTVTGSLPMALGLVAASAPVQAVSGTLPVALGLSGNAVAVRAVTGTLAVALGLTAVSVPSKTVTGSMPVALGLAATSIPSVTVTGALGLALGLVGTVGAIVPQVTGTLALSLGISGSATPVSVATGQLPLTLGLAAASTRVDVRSGAMPLSIGLTGTVGTTVATVTGALPMSIGLAASAVNVMTVSGALPLSLGLIGTVAGGPSRNITTNGTTSSRWAASTSQHRRTAATTRRRYEGITSE